MTDVDTFRAVFDLMFCDAATLHCVVVSSPVLIVSESLGMAGSSRGLLEMFVSVLTYGFP